MHRDVCHTGTSPLFVVWLTCHLERSFTSQFLLEWCANVIPLKWNSYSCTVICRPLFLHCCSIFLPVTLLFSLTLLLLRFHSFVRLMWPGKTCPMESLSTCAVLEKETGLERKHCKGKIVPNNIASSNLNLLFSRCFCLLHCHPLPLLFSFTACL